MTQSFNLVEQPWIPVVVAGRRQEVSLAQALLEAQQIDGLAMEQPLETAAVLRQVLLPVLLHSCGAPRDQQEWAARFGAGQVDVARVSDYLAEHRAQFDLADPVRPFAQVAGLTAGTGQTKPLAVLVAALPAGNNVPLYGAQYVSPPPAFSAAQAARAVLAAHCWDSAGLKTGAVGDPQARAGKTSGNRTGSLGALGVVIPVGRGLFATLLLNSPILPQGLHPADRPQWTVEHDPTWSERPAGGLLDLLTWQSRRIRLIGDQTGSYAQVVVCAGDRLAVLDPVMEPHTAWRQVDKPAAGGPPVRPVRHRVGRAAWQGMVSLLALRPVSAGPSITTTMMVRQLAEQRASRLVPADLRLQVLTVGLLYGTQSAVVEDQVSDLIPLPVTALLDNSSVRGLVLRLAEQADALRLAANTLQDNVAEAAGAGERMPWDKGQHLGQTLIGLLDPDVRRLLAGLQRNPDMVDEADWAWRENARRHALGLIDPLVTAAPPRAFLGRPAELGGRRHMNLTTALNRYQWAVRDILGDPEPAPDQLTAIGATP